MHVVDRNSRSEEFEQILAGAFRKAGMRLKRPVSAGDDGADLVFERDGTKYLVQLKVSSEGRSDRLIPLLSQAVLQARSHARQSGGATPVAVLRTGESPPGTSRYRWGAPAIRAVRASEPGRTGALLRPA